MIPLAVQQNPLKRLSSSYYPFPFVEYLLLCEVHRPLLNGATPSLATASCNYYFRSVMAPTPEEEDAQVLSDCRFFG